MAVHLRYQQPLLAMPPKTITIERKWVTKKSTISTFTTHDGSVTGFILEPAGVSTTISGIDKRIPAGTYNLVSHSSAKYPDVYKLYNSYVPLSRAILIHKGNYPQDTKGCLLPGVSKGKDSVNGSGTKLKQLNTYIAKFIEKHGVQVVIKEIDSLEKLNKATDFGWSV